MTKKQILEIFATFDIKLHIDNIITDPINRSKVRAIEVEQSVKFSDYSKIATLLRFLEVKDFVIKPYYNELNNNVSKVVIILIYETDILEQIEYMF